MTITLASVNVYLYTQLFYLFVFIRFSIRMVNSIQFFKIPIEINESCALIAYKMHNFRYNKQSESIEYTTITTSYQTNKRIAIIFKHTCSGSDDYVALGIYKIIGQK